MSHLTYSLTTWPNSAKCLSWLAIVKRCLSMSSRYRQYSTDTGVDADPLVQVPAVATASPGTYWSCLHCFSASFRRPVHIGLNQPNASRLERDLREVH